MVEIGLSHTKGIGALGTTVEPLFFDLPDGALILNHTGTVIAANSVACMLLGRDPTGAMFGHPGADGVVDVTVDGRRRAVELRSARRSGSADVVVTLRDVTGWRSATEHLSADNLDLRDAVSELTDAAVERHSRIAELRHEAGAPLTTLVGFSETLHDHWRELEPDQIQTFLAVMCRQSVRLQRLVERMVLQSRADAGELECEPESVVIREVLATAASSVQARGVNAAVECPEHLTAWVDPLHFDQIVTNLIENAMRYGSPPLVLHAVADGTRVRITARDHGRGVPLDIADRLFERGVRSRVHTGPAGPSGSGLGLHLVRALAHANGGTVHHEPATPGARFVVSLPAGQTV